MDVGLREQDGVIADEVVLRVLVSDLENVPPGIPTDISGIPITIVQRDPQIEADLARYPVVVGGISVGRLTPCVNNVVLPRFRTRSFSWGTADPVIGPICTTSAAAARPIEKQAASVKPIGLNGGRKLGSVGNDERARVPSRSAEDGGRFENSGW
ncbi:hypothetical protein NKI39_22100 [Mesorhizobium sp. M0664]|uniref:hypothetical protein n=1 Tax=Mesorhizobium sp. M0664 TaxID=2956982 RepID=UPI00333D056C